MKAFLALPLLACADSDNGLVVVGSGNVCAGTDDDDSFYISQNFDGCSASNLPKEYLKMDLQAFVMIKGGATAYLEDYNKTLVVDPATEHPDGYPLSVAHKADNVAVAGTNGKYAYTTGSGYFGTVDPNGQYGVIGTASYLATAGDWDFSENEFRMPNENQNDKAGVKYDVCVAGSTNCTTVAKKNVKVDGKDFEVPEHQSCECDASKKKSMSAGDYKFSLFGYTNGDNYENWVKQYTHYGVRQKLDLANMGGANAVIRFNGKGEWMKTSEIRDWRKNTGTATYQASNTIKTIEIKAISSAEEPDIAFEFPQVFVTGATYDPNGQHEISGHENIQINVEQRNCGRPAEEFGDQKACGTTGADDHAIYIDYVFKIGKGTEKKLGWFAYDPSITAKKVTTTTGTTTKTGTTTAASTTATTTTTAVASVSSEVKMTMQIAATDTETSLMANAAFTLAFKAGLATSVNAGLKLVTPATQIKASDVTIDSIKLESARQLADARALQATTDKKVTFEYTVNLPSTLGADTQKVSDLKAATTAGGAGAGGFANAMTGSVQGYIAMNPALKTTYQAKSTEVTGTATTAGATATTSTAASLSVATAALATVGALALF